ETNTYTDVNTFYNGYGLQASLVVFDGLQRYNELRMARANVAMGRSALQAEKDAVRLRVYKACMDLLYCEGAVEHTSRKRDESRALLHQVEVMAEVGQKSEADVAQMRATLAADDYELTHMQSQTTKALLALKQQMNFPIADTLIVEKPSVDAPLQSSDNAYNIYNVALATNPRIAQAESSVAAARYALRAARGAFLPTLSLSGGVSTSFYRNMDVGGHAPFSKQFKNNAGEYVALSLSIPIFNRLGSVSSVRSRRIALDRARESLCYERSELQRIIAEAVADVENSAKDVQKMKDQVEADSLAAYLTTRKFEEGMASSIDVRTAAVTLLQSRVKLLQSQLTMMYNRQVLAYYEK
uniref:TolC family protein n=1 Tax=Prevotella sp. TaxID=59823 RepID=UPI00402988FC